MPEEVCLPGSRSATDGTEMWNVRSWAGAGSSCERTVMFLLFPGGFLLLSSMSFFSLLIVLNTENTYSRYQNECKRLDVSLNRTLYLMMISYSP